MYKKAVIIALILLMAVLSSGCFGGSSPPTLNSSVAKLDAAVIKYNSIMSLYNGGNYSGAKAEYIAVSATFQECQSELETVSAENLTPLEKRVASSLAICAKQYAYAASYMRDSCTEAMKPGDNNAYLMKVSADEFEITASNTYKDDKDTLNQFWHSHS